MDSRRASSANISGEPLYYRGIRTEPKYSVGERVRLAHRPSAIGVIRVVDPFASREQYAVQWDDGSGIILLAEECNLIPFDYEPKSAVQHKPEQKNRVRKTQPKPVKVSRKREWTDRDAAVFADRQAGLSIIRTAIKHSVSRSAVQRIVRRGKAEGRGQ
jgi:hypothetical protein